MAATHSFGLLSSMHWAELAKAHLDQKIASKLAPTVPPQLARDLVLIPRTSLAFKISHFVRRFPFNPAKHPRNFRSLAPVQFGE